MRWTKTVFHVILITLFLGSTNCFQEPIPAGFVSMEEGRFFLDGQPFFPLVMNYSVSLVTDGDRFWPASYSGYEPDDRFHCDDPASCEAKLRAELVRMRDTGFNAVRIVKLAEGPTEHPQGEGMVLSAHDPQGLPVFPNYYDAVVRARYIEAVRSFVRIAGDVGLKVILLTTIHDKRPATRQNFTEVADALREEPAILAFDLFNEPLYFDLPAREKKSAYDVVRSWRRLAREHAPHHLITIGLTGIRETHAWDPDILDVDFISFHPYEYEPDQVLNELRWYGEHVRTPWIIGETSLPADGDSVPYEEQQRFAQRTLEQTVACGGVGYSWWQFKDVHWGRFHSDKMGLWTEEGVEKPTAEVFQKFDPSKVSSSCADLPNYHNYSQHRSAKLTGRLLDEQGGPIKGGVILAWNQDYSHSYHTSTRADGSFELLGDLYFHHWIASAIGHSMVRGDCSPGSYRRGNDSIPDLYLGDLIVKRLRFAEPG